MMRVVSTLAATLLLGLLAGCDAAGPDAGAPTLHQQDQLSIPPGLEVTLFAPERVAPGDSFEVRVTVENRTNRAIGFQTPSSCLVYPGIFSEGTRIEMKGSVIGCAAVVTERLVRPGQAQTIIFNMQAVRTEAGQEEPIQSGTYTLRVRLDWKFGERRVQEVLSGNLSVVPIQLITRQQRPPRGPTDAH